VTATVELPARRDSGPFFFSIDHCFPIKGQGTVITGTVLSGSVKVCKQKKEVTLVLLQPPMYVLFSCFKVNKYRVRTRGIRGSGLEPKSSLRVASSLALLFFLAFTKLNEGERDDRNSVPARD
jgi:hypothetical protein